MTRPIRPKNLCPAAVLSVLALGTLTLGGCAERPVPVSPDDAVRAYYGADTPFFERRFEPGSVAAALRAVARGEEDAPERLDAALGSVGDESQRDKLARLVVREHVIRYDYRAAAEAADRLGVPDALSDVERVYAGWPAPSSETNARVVEVPYENGRIPIRVNGRALMATFDTGAPNVGIDQAVVEERGLSLDRSASRMSRVPAYGLEFPVYGVRIDTLQIGDLTLRNIPANTGLIPPEQAESAARLKTETDGAEAIFGLDPIRNFVDVIEFDWDRDVLRLIIRDDRPKQAPNTVLNDGAAPVIRIRAGERVTNLSFDSGAYGHLVGPETVEAAPNVGERLYERDWGLFSEALIEIGLQDGPDLRIWASSRRFAESETYGVTGVIGVLNDGVLRYDMADRHLSIRDYDPAEAFYGFRPAVERIDPPTGP